MAKAGSLPLRVLALHGSNHCWREFEAVDVLWVSTGFFVGVIDMAVVL
jgi:hypothetical protein